MNYLAHAYLSFQRTDILVGNMLGDFVKGKRYLEFPPNLQRGILLHRAIDRYTDAHEVVLRGIDLLKNDMRLSAGVFIDMTFDHFLANDPQHFNEDSLRVFTEEVYKSLSTHHHHFDEKMSQFFGYMKEYNWLFHYRSQEGLERTVRGMCRRYPRLGDADRTVEALFAQLPSLQTVYQAFFPDLYAFAEKELQELENRAV